MADLADFVEGLVLGVAVDESPKTITIALRTATGVNFNLKLDGVDRFVLDEMREQNVIDRISVWDESSAEGDYRKVLFSLVAGREEVGAADPFSRIVDDASALIRRGERILVDIEPVYGAGVTGLARKLTFTKSGDVTKSVED